MKTAELLEDGFGRVAEAVRRVIEGLTADELTYRVDREANSIAWLVWHLTRVQDDHVAAVVGTEQLWTSSGWEQRFGLPLPASDTGYGHSPEQVALVTSDGETLRGYYDAVHEETLRFVRALTDGDLDRIVDERWDPPVTLGVRLVSVMDDDLEHVGQAAFLRGIVERR